MQTATREHTATATDSWAEINGRWFFAWRMAAACEDALSEIKSARAKLDDPQRAEALDTVSSLLRKELIEWVRRGEALDMIVERLPEDPC